MEQFFFEPRHGVRTQSVYAYRRLSTVGVANIVVTEYGIMLTTDRTLAKINPCPCSRMLWRFVIICFQISNQFLMRGTGMDIHRRVLIGGSFHSNARLPHIPNDLKCYSL